MLFPFGTYFPGFTLSAMISGGIYGMILYNKNNVKISNSKMLLKLIVSSLLVLVIVNIFLTSFWLKILYGNAYWIIVSTRIITQVIMLPIQVIVMFSLEKFTRPYVNKYLMEE